MLGLLVDAPSARRAHEAGIGAELDFSLGALSGLPGHEPVRGRFRVEALGDGGFTCTGPFYLGSRMALGPMAALRQGGVTVGMDIGWAGYGSSALEPSGFRLSMFGDWAVLRVLALEADLTCQGGNERGAQIGRAHV